VAAAQADEADVRAQANHFPVGTATGVRLAQANNVIKFQFWEHSGAPRHYNVPTLLR